MKTVLRTSAAAVLVLLAPVGAVLAQPAFGGNATIVAPQPRAQIERFVVRAMGPIEPGRELRFRLVGTPGAQARLDIPGVVRDIRMREEQPGVYVAAYVIRLRDNHEAFRRAVATLDHRGVQVTARVDFEREGGWHHRDRSGPVIADLTPSQGDRVGDRGRTRISARVTDEGSGVDPSTLLLRVDGRDVTGWARLDGDELRYRDDLRPGRHVAELSVSDRAGNVTRRSWTFDVVDRDRIAYQR